MQRASTATHDGSEHVLCDERGCQLSVSRCRVCKGEKENGQGHALRTHNSMTASNTVTHMLIMSHSAVCSASPQGLQFSFHPTVMQIMTGVRCIQKGTYHHVKCVLQLKSLYKSTLECYSFLFPTNGSKVASHDNFWPLSDCQCLISLCLSLRQKVQTFSHK